jgi:lipopolysaccharide/colanic/teichoic acid biosynthesis glycosyltransferase
MLKRVFDVVCAGAALVALFPLLAALALAIKVTSPGPVFYRGVRVGRHGRLFRIFKFRSMVTNADRLGGASTADGDPGLRRSAGSFARPSSMNCSVAECVEWHDELCRSRPEVQQYVNMYTEEEKAILSVRPGITGLGEFRNPTKERFGGRRGSGAGVSVESFDRTN